MNKGPGALKRSRGPRGESFLREMAQGYSWNLRTLQRAAKFLRATIRPQKKPAAPGVPETVLVYVHKVIFGDLWASHTVLRDHNQYVIDAHLTVTVRITRTWFEAITFKGITWRTYTRMFTTGQQT